MFRFYFFLWLKWALRVTLCSLFLAFLTSFMLTLFIYIQQGMVKLDSKVLDALYDVELFWFQLFWNVAFLIALFRGVKYIFNHSISGYVLHLFECQTSQSIEFIGYGNLIKVWRKYFMLLIWLVVSFMIFTTFIYSLIYSKEMMFEWFSTVFIYIATMIAGFLALVLLPSRSKQVKVERG